MIGSPERLGVWTSSSRSASEHTGACGGAGRARSSSPRRSFASKPGEHRRQRGDGRGSRVEVGRRRDLQQVLDLGRAGDEGEQRGVGLGEAADQDDVLVALAEVAHDAVAAAPVRTRLLGRALADHPEAVGVVDVQQRAVPARDLGERPQVGRVARSCC